MQRTLPKKIITRITTLLFAALILYAISVQGQDKFKVTQLTLDPAQQGFTTWSPDGKKIAFASKRVGNNDIWVKDVK